MKAPPLFLLSVMTKERVKVSKVASVRAFASEETLAQCIEEPLGTGEKLLSFL